MIKYLNTLKGIRLFQDIQEDAIVQIMQSKDCFFKRYRKGTTIYGFHQEAACPGVILEGTVDILQPSIHGHETIVNRITAGGTFGFAYAFTREKNRLNDIRCVMDSQIMFLDVQTLVREECLAADIRNTFLKNTLTILAANNIELNAKVQILGQKTLKEKLMAYFERLAEKNSSRLITLPFNREELACFLCSERSSVSRELSKLSEEGNIRIMGNQIELLA